VWDPADFYNITKLNVDPKDMWVPDTFIREDAGDNYLSDFKETPIRLYSEGTNYWSRNG
jgi:hypothetical protein